MTLSASATTLLRAVSFSSSVRGVPDSRKIKSNSSPAWLLPGVEPRFFSSSATLHCNSRLAALNTFQLLLLLSARTSIHLHHARQHSTKCLATLGHRCRAHARAPRLRRHQKAKHTTVGIPPWSPTGVLIHRSKAYVYGSGRDRHFSFVYGGMYQPWGNKRL